MIAEFWINLGSSMSTFFAGLFENVEIPGWATNSTGSLFAFLDGASGLAGWFPWSVLGTVLSFLVVLYGVVFAIRMLLKVWSIMPFGGGS